MISMIWPFFIAKINKNIDNIYFPATIKADFLLLIFLFFYFMKNFFLLALVALCSLFITSCGGDSKSAGKTDGYSRQELFGTSSDMSINNYMRKMFPATEGDDGKIYLGNPRFDHVIGNKAYANTDDAVTVGDQIKVWKKGDKFFLLRADPNVGLASQERFLRDWGRENLSDEQQIVSSSEEDPDFD